MDPERRYYFPIVGYNYRLTNVACAILCAQLERAEEILSRRREIFHRYRTLLEGIPGIGFQPVSSWAEPSPWLFCVTVDAEAYGRSRDGLMAWLDSQGIETRPFFIPIHSLPPYAEASRRRGESLPVTDALGSSGLNLPTFTRMSGADVERVAAAVRSGRP
jgi:perosamine synthetase